MKLTEYIEQYKKQGWDDQAEKEWRELQEDAEIMRKLQDEHMNIDFGLWAENDKIVELLKKRIEDRKQWLKDNKIWDKSNTVSWHRLVEYELNQLQKIMEEKKHDHT